MSGICILPRLGSEGLARAAAAAGFAQASDDRDVEATPQVSKFYRALGFCHAIVAMLPSPCALLLATGLIVF